MKSFIRFSIICIIFFLVNPMYGELLNMKNIGHGFSLSLNDNSQNNSFVPGLSYLQQQDENKDDHENFLTTIKIYEREIQRIKNTGKIKVVLGSLLSAVFLVTMISLKKPEPKKCYDWFCIDFGEEIYIGSMILSGALFISSIFILASGVNNLNSAGKLKKEVLKMKKNQSLELGLKIAPAHASFTLSLVF